jgi:outer membrane protein TolC
MLLLLLALQGVPASPRAQDSLPRVTLRLALERAARLDPNYVAALGQIDNAEWARRNAFAVFLLPSVTIGTIAQRTNPKGFFFTNQLLRVSTTWNAQLIARYDLFTGGQKIAELSRSAAELEGAHADELRQRFATALVTESDYYAVLADVELDRVARDRLRRAEEQLAVARARVVSGAAVSTDSLNLRLELARAQVGQLQQASALRVSRLELGRRVGVAGPVDAVALDTAPAQISRFLWPTRFQRPRARDRSIAWQRRTSVRPTPHTAPSWETTCRARR